MKLHFLGIALIVQCVGILGEVNNIVKSKIVFSNQDLVEKNSEVLHKTEETILSENEIFEFLEQQVPAQDVPKLKQLLGFITPRELRHLDFLIYLMSYYNVAAPHLLKAIFEILHEDETNFATLMRNFS